MGKVIGIDLGTTNSCVAVLEGSGSELRATVIPNSEGARTTPSIVAFTSSGDRLVGHVAKRQAATNPERTVFGVKRLMGRKFEDREVRRHVELAPYHVVESTNGDAWVKAGDKSMSPPEVSAIVLAKMKEVAEQFLGETVEEAVITVPAYFDDAQRQATKDAGKIAGLDVKRIINEPTAAALGYGLNSTERETIAVFDLGGGTFDISVLQMESGVFSVKATGGDTHLGGEDFDEVLIERFVAEFREANGVDLKKDRMALQRLREAAERAKHELSSSLETEINIPFIATNASGPLHMQREMKRSELEILCSELIERALVACQATLDDARMKVEQIDTVILVGGMTRMPAVQKAVREFFGKDPSRSVNPDEIVAIGAALQAGALTGDVDEILLLDVTPLSIGVETGGGVFFKLIERNTTIPTEASEIFTTSVDNQTFVPIHVLQGEREMAQDNRSLAEFELTGIPPAPRNVPKIKVTFRVDSNGILHVEAVDLGTGRQHAVRVTPASGLSQGQIEAIVMESEQHREMDAVRRELAELKNQAETLLYTTEQALAGYADLLNEDVVTDVRSEVDRLKGLLAAGSGEEIRAGYQSLEAAAFRIAESMYGEEG